MKLSRLFTKTEKETPKDETSVNAQLLEQAGFVYKNNSGIYTYLPLGWRTLNKINAIIREEMNALGATELLMPTLVNKRYWEASERWDVDVMYKLKDETGHEFGLGWTHEEVITEIAKRYVQSYKDLPFSAYQIQSKFRNEARAKSGILRGREFLMKDLYSFHRDEADLQRFYQDVLNSYLKVFQRLGLDAYVTEASGGAFTKEYTHEFQVLSEAGEDTIFYCEKCRYSQNKEITNLPQGGKCPKCDGTINVGKSIEVGNIFRLGTRFSKAFNLNFVDEKGESKPIVMGSYGIGPSRVMGTLAEVFHDKSGLLWPESVAPFKVYLIALDGAAKEAAKIYQRLWDHGVEVLYDDRDDKGAGEKFADADLIGLPIRVIVSSKTLKEKSVEVKRRGKPGMELVPVKDIGKTLEK
ncbi:MAG: aminoacyl--tRNA ligase-related protein [bacterium]|nr:aminoacyl--tRNA ligase-related protein [bacterium]